MDNMPSITLQGIKFKDLTQQEKLSVLNFIAGILWSYDLLTTSERKKVFERTQKKINKV